MAGRIGSIQKAADGKSYGFVVFDETDRACVYLGFSTWHDADRAAGSAWLVGDGAGLRPTVRPAAAAISKRGAFRKDGTRQKGGKRTIRLTRSVGGVRPLYVHHHLPPTGPIAQKAPGSVSQWVCPASSFSD
jgi:hypothetical protein